MDEMVEIRKSALDILAYLGRTREDVLKIIKEIEILDLALEYIKAYPNEFIDNEVLISSLNLISFAV
jgi:CRISPR/Cas system Type II protein with McrA/HNH and RuvC-like nuclease domain